ncbi:efflux RND transporter periplasmic adaptor subunit [Pseudomonas citronellolis]|uniref:efflux RND transporter periplasmic adaptor subunit n=1 Tax=Pseudomonas citronellolis TaxID=53408 RepID=UPI0023E46A32|nr:efflux RND transporter periplasmic adaptor subunit [Pseudomonas citronellolis]MDF3933720.1 efflux RND transporter periplasmic adaptor subunit [Pseudomonas citronellolis]
MSPSPASSQRRYWRLALLFLGVALAVFAWRHFVASAPAKPAEAPVPVSLAVADQRDLPIWLQTIGTVQALNTVNIKVRVDGELQQLHFQEGQMVKAGQLLAEIDPRPYAAQVLQAKANKARDEAQLTVARVNLDRAAKLAAAHAGPSQDVDTLRGQVATLQATLQADQAALDTAQLQLGYTRIAAPFAGRTGQRLVDAGSIVHASDTGGLLTLTQMAPISLAFSLPQEDLAEVLQANAGQPLQVEALSRDGRQHIASGRLSFIDSQVSSGNGQILFKADFDNADGKLWPGELLSARLLLRTEKAATVVPSGAVQQGPQGSFVYVVGRDQQAQVREVKAGAVVDGLQWIHQGLAPGETVVASGQYRLAPGLKVSALADPRQTASAEQRP